MEKCAGASDYRAYTIGGETVVAFSVEPKHRKINRVSIRTYTNDDGREVYVATLTYKREKTERRCGFSVNYGMESVVDFFSISTKIAFNK